ncbi:hypothetical protein Tco_0898791 [Tanacetum coccineum]
MRLHRRFLGTFTVIYLFIRPLKTQVVKFIYDYVFLNIGSPRADDHEYLELPGMPEDPYVEAALQAPPSPDYVLEDASPSCRKSPDYVPESDPEADPEEDDDEDPEEDPVDYPADGGDDGDDEEGSSEDDEDDDMDIEADDEEEHLAPADSVVVALPATDQAPSTEETEPFETDESAATPPPHLAYRVIVRISIPAPPLPQIPSPSLPLSPPLPVLSPALPPSPICSLGYRATMIRMRAEAASTSHSLPSHHPLSPWTDPRLPYHLGKRLGYRPWSRRYEVRRELIMLPGLLEPAEGLKEADYGFVATMDREIRRDPEREVGYGITDSDRRAHAYTRHQMETEARFSREAWRRSMDARDRGDFRDAEGRLGQISEIRELHAADRRRQAMTSGMLKANHWRSIEMRELRTANRTRQQQLIRTLTGQQGPTGGPAQPELPEEAGSSS